MPLLKIRKDKPRYALKISASLLNSWKYLETVNPFYYNKSYKEFVNTIFRIPFGDTVWTLRGKEFEEVVIEGKVPMVESFTNRIKGSTFQEHVEGTIEVDEHIVYLHGYTDASDDNNNIVYDIKRKNDSSYEEFYNSYQTYLYLYLKPSAKEMTYLVGQSKDTNVLPENLVLKEYTYKREDMGDIDKKLKDDIRSFFSWLKKEGLFKAYVNNYTVDLENMKK